MARGKDGRELPEQEEVDRVEGAENLVQICILRPDAEVKSDIFPVIPREEEKHEQLIEMQGPLTESPTIHVLEEDEVLGNQTDDKTSSWKIRVSEEVEASGVPTLRTDWPSKSTRDLSMVSDARREPTQEEIREEEKPTQDESDAPFERNARP